MTKEDVNDVYKLIMEQRARIEALEAALREIDAVAVSKKVGAAKRMQAIARAALAEEQDK